MLLHNLYMIIRIIEFHLCFRSIRAICIMSKSKISFAIKTRLLRSSNAEDKATVDAAENTASKEDQLIENNPDPNTEAPIIVPMKSRILVGKHRSIVSKSGHRFNSKDYNTTSSKNTEEFNFKELEQPLSNYEKDERGEISNKQEHEQKLQNDEMGEKSLEPENVIICKTLNDEVKTDRNDKQSDEREPSGNWSNDDLLHAEDQSKGSEPRDHQRHDLQNTTPQTKVKDTGSHERSREQSRDRRSDDRARRGRRSRERTNEKKSHDRSKDKRSFEQSIGSRSHSRNRRSQERSRDRRSLERLRSKRSRERSRGRKSQDRSRDKKSADRSKDRRSRERSKGKLSREHSRDKRSRERSRRKRSPEIIQDRRSSDRLRSRRIKDARSYEEAKDKKCDVIRQSEERLINKLIQENMADHFNIEEKAPFRKAKDRHSPPKSEKSTTKLKNRSGWTTSSSNSSREPSLERTFKKKDTSQEDQTRGIRAWSSGTSSDVEERKKRFRKKSAGSRENKKSNVDYSGQVKRKLNSQGYSKSKDRHIDLTGSKVTKKESKIVILQSTTDLYDPFATSSDDEPFEETNLQSKTMSKSDKQSLQKSISKQKLDYQQISEDSSSSENSSASSSSSGSGSSTSSSDSSSDNESDNDDKILHGKCLKSSVRQAVGADDQKNSSCSKQPPGGMHLQKGSNSDVHLSCSTAQIMLDIPLPPEKSQSKSPAKEAVSKRDDPQPPDNQVASLSSHNVSPSKPDLPNISTSVSSPSKSTVISASTTTGKIGFSLPSTKQQTAKKEQVRILFKTKSLPIGKIQDGAVLSVFEKPVQASRHKHATDEVCVESDGQDTSEVDKAPESNEKCSLETTLNISDNGIQRLLSKDDNHQQCVNNSQRSPETHPSRLLTSETCDKQLKGIHCSPDKPRRRSTRWSSAKSLRDMSASHEDMELAQIAQGTSDIQMSLPDFAEMVTTQSASTRERSSSQSPKKTKKTLPTTDRPMSPRKSYRPDQDKSPRSPNLRRSRRGSATAKKSERRSPTPGSRSSTPEWSHRSPERMYKSPLTSGKLYRRSPDPKSLHRKSPTPERSQKRSPSPKVSRKRSSSSQRSQRMSPTPEKSQKKSQSPEQSHMRSPTPERARRRSPNQERSQRRSPNAVQSRKKSPTPERNRRPSPTPEKPRRKSPTSEKLRRRSYTPERSQRKSQSQTRSPVRSRRRSPSPKARRRTPPSEKCRRRSPSPHRSRRRSITPDRFRKRSLSPGRRKQSTSPRSRDYKRRRSTSRSRYSGRRHRRSPSFDRSRRRRSTSADKGRRSVSYDRSVRGRRSPSYDQDDRKRQRGSPSRDTRYRMSVSPRSSRKRRSTSPDRWQRSLSRDRWRRSRSADRLNRRRDSKPTTESKKKAGGLPLELSNIPLPPKGQKTAGRVEPEYSQSSIQSGTYHGYAPHSEPFSSQHYNSRYRPPPPLPPPHNNVPQCNVRQHPYYPPPPLPMFEFGGDSDIESVEMDGTRSPGTPTMHELDQMPYELAHDTDTDEPKKVAFTMKHGKAKFNQNKLDAFAEETEMSRPPLPAKVSPGSSIYGRVPVSEHLPVTSQHNLQILVDASAEESDKMHLSSPTALATASDATWQKMMPFSEETDPLQRPSSALVMVATTTLPSPVPQIPEPETQDRAVTSSMSVSDGGATEHDKFSDDDLYDTALFVNKEHTSVSDKVTGSKKSYDANTSKVDTGSLSLLKAYGDEPKDTDDQDNDKGKRTKSRRDSAKAEDEDGDTPPPRRSSRLRKQEKPKEEEKDKTTKPESEKKKRGRGRPRKERDISTDNSEITPAATTPNPTKETADIVTIVRDEQNAAASAESEFAIPASVPRRDMPPEFGSPTPSSRPEKVKSRWRRWSELEATNDDDGAKDELATPLPVPTISKEEINASSTPLPHKIAFKQEYASNSSAVEAKIAALHKEVISSNLCSCIILVV